MQNQLSKNKKLLFIILIFVFSIAKSQVTQKENPLEVDYEQPKTYVLGGVDFKGTTSLDRNFLLKISGLTTGEFIQIPGDDISEAIKKLWDEGFFSDIKVELIKVVDDKVYLRFVLVEKPRLSSYEIIGIRKGEKEKLKEKINLNTGIVVTENLILTTKKLIEDYFYEDGFYHTKVAFTETPDTTGLDKVKLTIQITPGYKTKIHQINITGNEQIKATILKRKLKETKESQWYNLFRNSKFIKNKYEEDKQALIEHYNNKGYRDAILKTDSVYNYDDKSVSIDLKIEEGNKYYFRNVSFIGNTKYSSDTLMKVLNIKKGDPYSQKDLDTKLFMNPNGQDISSLYLDNGYLFFSLDPVEIKTDNDSIDLEIRIYEGKQATINKITIVGNTKTNDKVIMREIRTKPGALFRRSDIMRTQRELSQLNYFDPEKMGVNPTPNQANGTVDIEYTLEEKPSDQIELSGGWGGKRIVGTLGLTFNNFSTNNFFKKGAWTPVPSGDGQRLGIRAQSNGSLYQSYSISFTEPWLGGKKPNSLSVSLYKSKVTTNYEKSDPNYGYMNTLGASLGFGKRLKWPDDYFSIYLEAGYQNYKLVNYARVYPEIGDGISNALSFSIELSRNSVDQPLFPKYGSKVSFSITGTPPIATWLLNSSNQTNSDYKWTEYHKYKFDASWFSHLFGEMVLMTQIKYGFLGYYNKNIGMTPFQRYYLGGDGLTGYQLDEREVIGLRGYKAGGSDTPLTPLDANGNEIGGTIYSKYTMELRYRFSSNPSATIYGLAFAEAGNSWSHFSEYSPFNVKRSLGVGVRVFMPMFGLLGLDYGYGFDESDYQMNAGGGNFHFSIGQQF